jgi:hypothetical protein
VKRRAPPPARGWRGGAGGPGGRAAPGRPPPRGGRGPAGRGGGGRGPAPGPLDRAYPFYRVPGLDSRRFTHQEYWAALTPVIDASPRLLREEIGRSAEGRPIQLVRYGAGPVRVLLWSQMHGNESTATMALADIFRFLADSPDHPLARRLHERLTILAVPMLNPDGAERFQRRNAQGIDVNRDARALATPEGRALKAMQERFSPRFGFNLHDQNVRIGVGREDRTAAISLLAPPFDEARSDDDVRLRAKRLAAVLRYAAEPFVPGHITRYDDTFTPRAFGDLMQAWGTSTVLVESGGWADDPQKQYLRRVHFTALLLALDAIATGDYATAPLAAYDELPENGPLVNDLLLRGGSVALPGHAPYVADIAIDFADPLERTGGRIADIGDLADHRARDTLDVQGLVLHPGRRVLDEDDPQLRPGAPASFTVRRGESPDADVVWVIEEGRVRPAQER